MSAALAQRMEHLSQPNDVAGAAALIFQSIEAGLSPIVGGKGVAALYRRSLFLSKTAHSCLVELHAGAAASMDLAALRTTLARVDAGESLPAATALLHAFSTLLVSLIGDSLTDQLLEGVWALPEPGPPSQDLSS